MQVVQVDPVDFQAAQTLLDVGSQHFWAGPSNPAFRGHDAALGNWSERLTDRFLALSAGVYVRGIDHLNAGGDSRLDEIDVVLRLGQPVRSQTNPSHVGIA
jgi:hypothetical protein